MYGQWCFPLTFEQLAISTACESINHTVICKVARATALMLNCGVLSKVVFATFRELPENGSAGE